MARFLSGSLAKKSSLSYRDKDKHRNKHTRTHIVRLLTAEKTPGSGATPHKKIFHTTGCIRGRGENDGDTHCVHILLSALQCRCDAVRTARRGAPFLPSVPPEPRAPRGEPSRGLREVTRRKKRPEQGRESGAPPPRVPSARRLSESYVPFPSLIAEEANTNTKRPHRGLFVVSIVS